MATKLTTKRIKIKKSFVSLLVRYFLFYSLVLVVVFVVLNNIINTILQNAFPSIDSFMRYEYSLQRDNFAAFSQKTFKNCQYIIFDDEKGITLFVSGNEIAQNIGYDDKDLVVDYMDKKSYTIYEQTSNGETYYKVLLCRHDAGGLKKIIGVAKVDSSLNVSGDDIFGGRKKLTQDEFEIIRGFYDKKSMIEKYEYQTVYGEERTLVMVYPKVDAMQYERLLNKTNLLWLAAVGIILIVMAIEVLLFCRKIRKYTKVINDACSSYKLNNSEIEIDKSEIPAEFVGMTDEFSQLVKTLESERLEKERMYSENRRIIANISHDLKTPLTVIQGYSEALSEGKVPKEKVERYLTTINTKAALASELIDSLFEYVRIEHPEYKPNIEMMDLSEHIKDILADKYNEIEDNGFALEIDIEDKICYAADKKLIRRLLENLVGNAVKHNSPGTTIYVKMNKDKDGVIRLSVADNGSGIDYEMSHKIFDAFVTKNSARPAGQGTGLGLTIASKAAQLCSGEIVLVENPPPPCKTMFLITFKG